MEAIRFQKLLTLLSEGMLLSIIMVDQNSTAQILEKVNSNSGSSRNFTFQVISSYGVNTSANASPNLKVDTEAVLVLKKDSYLTNTAGKVGGSTGATFVTTANGSNVELTGITVDNRFLIDQGTKFRAALSTSELDGQPSIGNASASAFHSMTLSVIDSQSAFVNTIRQNFEGAQ